MSSSFSRARARGACPFLCLLASLAWGQVAQPALPPNANTPKNIPATDKPSEVQVGPDEPVITLDGFCAESSPHDRPCKTVITRAQFEKLTDALQPGMSLELRLKVANAYARMIKMAAAAEKRGLDKTPAFEEEMRYARMQLLSQDLSHALQEEANNISEADLKDYYHQNQPSFEQATLARIFIPHSRRTASANESTATNSAAAQPSAPDQPAAQEHVDAAAMKQLAADLHARAANGEDPDKLQLEAYTAAGISGANSNTRMEKVRRAMLPPQHEAVMDLKPGQISQVFSDPEGAHFIYKMLGKETVPFDDAKAEIRRQMANQRHRNSMKAFQADVVFNDAYFVPAGSQVSAPHSHRRETAPESQRAPGHE
jgi:parvulin-like peptidyl-prolyl isomerase